MSVRVLPSRSKTISVLLDGASPQEDIGLVVSREALMRVAFFVFEAEVEDFDTPATTEKSRALRFFERRR